MKIHSKRYAAIFMFFIAVSCDQAPAKKIINDSSTDTSKAIITPSSPMPTSFKEIILNEKTVIAGKKLSASMKIMQAQYNAFSINVLDSAGTSRNEYIYHLVDTVFIKPGIRILLVGREYDSENYIWLVVYNDQNKPVDFKAVYYDNAEGFLSVETMIKKDQLTITTLNDFAESESEKKKVERFQLGEDNKLIKLK
jgi:hypothetical protein